jgi:exopolyphosphatase/pppGpp-phosphohydrolase
MKMWAKAMDPDFSHAERVARLSLQLYDGLMAARVFGSVIYEDAENDGGPRSSLYAAALLHDVGKAMGKKGHHKESQELIERHGTPLGWEEADMRRAAVVARFHAGALPTRSHKALRDLLPDEQKVIIRLSAVLRLANALDSAHDGSVRRLKIEDAVGSEKRQTRTNGFLRRAPAVPRHQALVIAAEGLVAGSATAQTVAAERYLLETVVQRPVMVKAIKPASAAGSSS